VAGGLVYFGARDGYLYGLDATSGELIWEWREGPPISSSMAVTDGVVYVTTTAGQVIAIGGEEGEAMMMPTTTTTTTAPPIEQGPGAG
jgi:outer membrane protein assembly factor BamB